MSVSGGTPASRSSCWNDELACVGAPVRSPEPEKGTPRSTFALRSEGARGTRRCLVRGSKAMRLRSRQKMYARGAPRPKARPGACILSPLGRRRHFPWSVAPRAPRTSRPNSGSSVPAERPPKGGTEAARFGGRLIFSTGTARTPAARRAPRLCCLQEGGDVVHSTADTAREGGEDGHGHKHDQCKGDGVLGHRLPRT